MINLETPVIVYKGHDKWEEKAARQLVTKISVEFDKKIVRFSIDVVRNEKVQYGAQHQTPRGKRVMHVSFDSPDISIK